MSSRTRRSKSPSARRAPTGAKQTLAEIKAAKAAEVRARKEARVAKIRSRSKSPAPIRSAARSRESKRSSAGSRESKQAHNTRSTRSRNADAAKSDGDGEDSDEAQVSVRSGGFCPAGTALSVSAPTAAPPLSRARRGFVPPAG